MMIYSRRDHREHQPESGHARVVALLRSETGRIETKTPNLREALVVLVRSHHTRVVRFLSIRLGSVAEAEEAAQEAYVHLLQWIAAAQADLAPGEARQHNLQTLLYVTARNIAIDRLRRRGRQQAQQRQQDWSDIDDATPERIVSGRQQLDTLRKLITQLPPKCQYAFVGYKIHGMSYAEIAEDLHLTESMIRKYVLRALAHCASHFDWRDDRS